MISAMKLIVLIFGICSCGISVSTQESGQCSGLENIPGRNLLFNSSLEVDPCANSKIQKCLKSNTEDRAADNCTVQGDSTKCPFKLLVADYDKWTKTIKVHLMLSVNTEFFIEVRSFNNESGDSIVNSARLGHFEDTVFRECNSYACCNPEDSTLTNVARRCPSASTNAPSALPFNKNFYSIAYLWHVPQDVEMDVIFVASIIPSPVIHWESVKSAVVHVNTLKPIGSATLPPPPPLPRRKSVHSTFETSRPDNGRLSRPTTPQPLLTTENDPVIISKGLTTPPTLAKLVTATLSSPNPGNLRTAVTTPSPSTSFNNTVIIPTIGILMSTTATPLAKSVGRPIKNANHPHGSIRRHFTWPNFETDATIIIIKKKMNRKTKVHKN